MVMVWTLRYLTTFARAGADLAELNSRWEICLSYLRKTGKENVVPKHMCHPDTMYV